MAHMPATYLPHKKGTCARLGRLSLGACLLMVALVGCPASDDAAALQPEPASAQAAQNGFEAMSASTPVLAPRAAAFDQLDSTQALGVCLQGQVTDALSQKATSSWQQLPAVSELVAACGVLRSPVQEDDLPLLLKDVVAQVIAGMQPNPSVAWHGWDTVVISGAVAARLQNKDITAQLDPLGQAPAIAEVEAALAAEKLDTTRLDATAYAQLLRCIATAAMHGAPSAACRASQPLSTANTHSKKFRVSNFSARNTSNIVGDMTR